VAGTFGPALGATFVRIGARPAWSDFYQDDRRSGSALFDLHLHDADFVSWCWGTPAEVTSRGSPRHLATQYRLTEGPALAVAEGGWLDQPGVGFRMRYTVELAEAVVDFDLTREPPVLLTRGSVVEPVRFPPATAYELQAEHFLDLVLGRTDRPAATVSDAYRVTTVLAAERLSLERNAPIQVAGATGGP
jgi:predicted dehydrogenase